MGAQFHRQVLSFSKLTLELALEIRALPSLLADQTTSRIVAELGKKLHEELRLRRGLPLACGVMCFVSSSYVLDLPTKPMIKICFWSTNIYVIWTPIPITLPRSCCMCTVNIRTR